MSRSSCLTFAFLILGAFSVQTASAQITIKIPDIPGFKKSKREQPKRPEPPPPEQPATTTTGDDHTSQPPTSQTSESQPTTPSSDKYADNVALNFHIEEIQKRQKQADEYDPADDAYFVSSSNYDYLLFAVSPRAREKWMKDFGVLDIRDTPNNRLDAALDALAASAAKKMPIYKPVPANFAFRNPAEEKMMKGTLKNLATLKALKIGLAQSNWLISKNDFGLPTARYKQGYIWVRDTADDHPYCRLYQINIIQDYAGGGTYGASYATFIDNTLFGCP